MSTDTVIEVADLRVDYGTTTAVDRTSFTVSRGEVFALLGTNGAGKTTTLDVLEGYREATAGAASVFGADPLRYRDRLAPRIGIMLQDAGFFETLTVRQTVTAWRRFYRDPRSLDEAVGLVGLSHRVDTRVSSLSGGERRRLDLALALLGHPELLFLDEPTTGMDPEGRHQSLELVAGLVREGLTVVLTTHYLEEAEQLADRVAIMHRGTIRRMGTLEQVRAESGDARIGFEVPADMVTLLPATLQASIDQKHGNARVEVRDADPERVLRQLFSWADAHDVMLLGLEVRRGSLEDVFLSLPEEPENIGRMPGTVPPGGNRKGGTALDGDRGQADHGERADRLTTTGARS
ncbi:MAG: ABC transporter ATP-binding protein [Humibacillus sp.]|nr:ABC transporter ATP-binding protein [Humibacillus sp.]MDN5776519.1 ABC transporter ATP-binding protein [Humibacillus sp.]